MFGRSGDRGHVACVTTPSDGCGLHREAGGVVEEHLVRSGLDQQRRQSGQVGEDGADQGVGRVCVGQVVRGPGPDGLSARWPGRRALLPGRSCCRSRGEQQGRALARHGRAGTLIASRACRSAPVRRPRGGRLPWPPCPGGHDRGWLVAEALQPPSCSPQPGPHRRTGAGITEATRRLRQHGIEPRQARNTALAAWASDLPPAVLASLLGVHIQTAVNWASHTRRDWTTYLAERVRVGSPAPRKTARP